MSLEYSITYSTENCYEHLVDEAFWQFLILPEENDSQEVLHWSFTNSLRAGHNLSINGLGFSTIQVRPEKKFDAITFELECKLLKKDIPPKTAVPDSDASTDYEQISQLEFRIENEPFLRNTPFTTLPKEHNELYVFDKDLSVFENLKALNHWTFIHLYYKTGVTSVETTLGEIINKRHGVCQDFSHLFCAIARAQHVPTRYVSGYIHQGNDYFGDSQMHAWVEALVPNLGWVGFDPTNDILAAQNHIKVAHGKDYSDCAPLKGVVYTSGSNKTRYTVKVQAEQLQQ